MKDGNCKHCGQPKEHRERGRCNACMAKYVAARRAKDPEAHRQKEKERWAKRTEEQRLRKNATRIKWLNSDPEIRKRHAAAAMDKRKTWTAERKAQQKTHQGKHYAKLQIRREQGVCAYSVNCHELPVGTQKFCLFHWCRGLALADWRLKTHFKDHDLVALWNRQEGKCAITGITLIPGHTAHLDHIIPVKHGGVGTLENVRFVHRIVNRMKWDCSDEEFKKLLAEILPGLIAWCKKDVDE